MKTIGLFFGGLSNEHEVSIASARNVVKNFDYKKYKLTLIYWRKQDGCFYHVGDIKKLRSTANKQVRLEDFRNIFDIALLMTHGRYGEDGVLQGLLESQKIKYCGCRVLSSALCMDKGIFKILMSANNIRQVKYGVLNYWAYNSAEIKKEFKKIKSVLKFPIYVKPANSGSSVGITRVTKPANLSAAISAALKHDYKIIIEEGLNSPKEIEVAVLGNKKLTVSRPGELRLVKDFYDFDDKYKKGQTQVLIPAQISAVQTRKIRKMAEQIYRLAGCQGFARVDFFIGRGQIYINEINTLPGFTDISMFPMLMMDTGLSYREILNKIISLAQ
ncbi:MAG: D-alanine--D-alanine ligase family protein [bacterium]|nr:D-alanine--D-alanine ligase family protein [bacterium]